MSARRIHRAEYALLAILLLAFTVREWDAQISWHFWALLRAPDVLGYLPAHLMGAVPERGALPPRGVWLYNVWPTFMLCRRCGLTSAIGHTAGAAMSAPRLMKHSPFGEEGTVEGAR